MSLPLHFPVHHFHSSLNAPLYLTNHSSLPLLIFGPYSLSFTILNAKTLQCSILGKEHLTTGYLWSDIKPDQSKSKRHIDVHDTQSAERMLRYFCANTKTNYRKLCKHWTVVPGGGWGLRRCFLVTKNFDQKKIGQSFTFAPTVQCVVPVLTYNVNQSISKFIFISIWWWDFSRAKL